MEIYNKQGETPVYYIFFVLSTGILCKIKCPGAWAIDIAG